MNKKGFTLIELLGVIILLSILFTFAFFAYSRYLKMSRRKVLEVDIKSMETAALDAINECQKGSNNAFCSTFTIPEPGETAVITYKSLVDNDYIDHFKNPYNKDEYCNLNESYVKIIRNVTNNMNGDVDKSDISFSYITCLLCENDGDQSKFTMARIMKKKGINNNEIINCTNLSQNQVENLSE